MPFTVPESGLRSVASSPSRASAADPKTARLRVLVVEDNTINRLVALRILRRLGHDAVGVARGSEVIETLCGASFDVILMDIRMPGMDGVETTQAIRADCTGAFDPNVPIVAVTAHAMPGVRTSLMAHGFTDYLSKPVDITDLAEALERLFPGSAAASA
jgi:CheY-like chemotaxis protein